MIPEVSPGEVRPLAKVPPDVWFYFTPSLVTLLLLGVAHRKTT